MRIASVGRAFPQHYYDQKTIIDAFKAYWGPRLDNPRLLERLHRNVMVGGRHLALPIEAYPELTSFSASNDAFVRCAVDLGVRAIGEALDKAKLTPRDVDHLMFVSSTGIATPSVDAHLVNRLELREDIKRTPTFGLGCVAGATGIARMADYLKAYPGQVAVLLSVELCSLTLQRRDTTIANVVSSGLFGDGAAAVVMVGAEREADGPRVLATRSVFYPHTEEVMGWRIGEEGFRVVLSAHVPDVVRKYTRRDVDAFLGDQNLSDADISHYLCHTGGPKVLKAFEEVLDLPKDALTLSWKTLAEVGNLSSASVLLVLHDTLYQVRPKAEELGLMISMGPGFGSQLVLLQW